MLSFEQLYVIESIKKYPGEFHRDLRGSEKHTSVFPV